MTIEIKQVERMVAHTIAVAAGKLASELLESGKPLLP